MTHDRKGKVEMCPRELKAIQDGGRSRETLLLPSPSLPSPLSITCGEGEEKERSLPHHIPPLQQAASLKQDQADPGEKL